jgi:hypothetical protein
MENKEVIINHWANLRILIVDEISLLSAGNVYNREINEMIIKHWADSHLLIIDEISFADKELLEQVDGNLKELKQNHYKPYSGFNIAFMGDFRQLEPISQYPLYRDYGNAISFADKELLEQVDAKLKELDDFGG